MFNRRLVAALFVSVIMCSGPFIYADSINVGDYVYFTNDAGRDNGYDGGPFTIHKFLSPNVVWESFCLERNEYLSWYDGQGPLFYIDDIGPAAIRGGVNVTNSFNEPSYAPITGSDPISPETAWLYSHYRQGLFGPLDSADKKAIQLAIWWFENEIGDIESSYGFDRTTNTFISQALTNASPSDLQYVSVVNIRWGGPDGDLAQSQLTYVPEPGTLVLLGSGILSLALLGRRFRK